MSNAESKNKPPNIEIEPIKKFTRAIALILDIDDTMVTKGLSVENVTLQVDKFNKFLNERLKFLFSKGKTAIVMPVFLTTRPADAIIDITSNLHPLLGIRKIATAVNPHIRRAILPEKSPHVLNMHDFGTQTNPVIFLCEQGAVKLAPTAMLTGEFIETEVGYGIQIAPELQNYCDTTRKILLEAIASTGIIGQNYHLEEGTLVNVSIVANDNHKITPDERRKIVKRIHQVLAGTDQAEIIQDFFVDDSDAANDIDFFPKQLENRKQFASTEITAIVKKLEQIVETSRVELVIADDKYSAVNTLLYNLQPLSNIIKVLVPANADRKLIEYAREHLTKAVLSSYNTFEGILAGLETIIEDDKYIYTTEEMNKFEKINLKRRGIISVGEYAAYAVNGAQRKSWLECEQRTCYFRNIFEFYYLCIDPKTRKHTLTKEMLQGMQFILSYDSDAKTAEADESILKRIFDHLSVLQENDAQSPTPIIIFKTSNNLIRRRYHYARPPSQEKNLQALTVRNRQKTRVGEHGIEETEQKYCFSTYFVDGTKPPPNNVVYGEPSISIYNEILEEDIEREKKEALIAAAERLGVTL